MVTRSGATADSSGSATKPKPETLQRARDPRAKRRKVRANAFPRANLLKAAPASATRRQASASAPRSVQPLCSVNELSGNASTSSRRRTVEKHRKTQQARLQNPKRNRFSVRTFRATTSAENPPFADDGSVSSTDNLGRTVEGCPPSFTFPKPLRRPGCGTG